MFWWWPPVFSSTVPWSSWWMFLVLHSAKLSHIRVCGPEPQSVHAGPSLVWFPDVLPALLKSSCGWVCPAAVSFSWPVFLLCICLQPELWASVILFDLFLMMSLISAFYTSVNPGSIHVGSPHFGFQLSSPQGGFLCMHPWSCMVPGLLFSVIVAVGIVGRTLLTSESICSESCSWLGGYLDFGHTHFFHRSRNICHFRRRGII